MRIEEFVQKINKNETKDGHSISIVTVEEGDVIVNERSKIVQQLHTGSFSDIVHHHEVRKGESYGIYYQRSVTGCDENGNRVTLAKLKFPTFTLMVDDGDLIIRQGKISQ